MSEVRRTTHVAAQGVIWTRNVDGTPVPMVDLIVGDQAVGLTLAEVSQVKAMLDRQVRSALELAARGQNLAQAEPQGRA